MLGYIYKTTNTINGHFYIGKRYGDFDHNYYGSGVILKQALAKYGKESFVIEVMCYCETEHELNEQEVFHIAEYQPWYNIALGGTGGNTMALADNDRRREIIAKRAAGIKRAHANRTAEDKQRINVTISEAKKGKASHRPGYKHSVDTKQKISDTNKQTRADWTAEQKDEYNRKRAAASAKRKGVPNTACYKPVAINGTQYDSIKNAARALGVSLPTIYNKTKKGEWTIEYT